MKPKKYTVLSKELTDTVIKVLILDIYCKTRKDAANILGISVNTVKSHLKTYKDAFNVSSTREIHCFGIDNGFYNNGYFQGDFLFYDEEGLPFPKPERLTDTGNTDEPAHA